MAFTDLETQAQTRARQAIIFGAFSKNIPGIHKKTNVMRHPNFHSRTGLAKRLLHLVKLMARAPKNIGRDGCIGNRQPRDQVSRRTVNKVIFGVFAVNIAAHAQITREKIIHAHARTQTRVVSQDVAGNVIDIMLAERAARETIDGKFLRMVERADFTRQAVCRGHLTEG